MHASLGQQAVEQLLVSLRWYGVTILCRAGQMPALAKQTDYYQLHNLKADKPLLMTC